MDSNFMKNLWKAALLVMSMLMLHTAMAAGAPENFQTVDGVAIYLGVIPAQIVLGHPTPHPEARMHGGIPTGRNTSHLVVALFDNASGKRIENAQVTAEVNELGLGGTSKKLETMRIADTITYGNYFDLLNEKTYRIRLSIRLPGRAQPIEASFTQQHFVP